MLACILIKLICFTLMKMCVLPGLELKYILWTEVWNLRFKFQQHIKNLWRPSNNCGDLNNYVGSTQNLMHIGETTIMPKATIQLNFYKYIFQNSNFLGI